ncbi:MAG: hypothetical protein A2X12_11655 [Bacteroidetes bacterium GWE2_29_8]|nr:MAG: hypothetical protein A2X12_11655 [Bacteroidetes bacterium GWE2_29_8]OFY24373.1 MAG: hypothetical protein A2X02_08255 [Bacteroidetes bacterium GWF2_29_10]
MDSFFNILFDFTTYFFFVFTVTMLLSYILIGVYSAKAMLDYSRKNNYVDYRDILNSKFTPPISIIAPAYNEGMTIVENILSLLSLYYGEYEVIIVNDGSKDDSMEKLIKYFHLKKVDFYINYKLPCQPIRGIYESTNPIYNKLIIIDKENGGKSDALNSGINIAKYDLFCAVDVDTIIEPDSLLKVIKPFLEEKTKVIATGGVIRISNSCIIDRGRISEVILPKETLPRIQTLEYIRSFLLGRMGWSKLNGLLIISGAFGLFDKKVVIDSGGYNKNTVTEDFEIVVRIRKFMEDLKMPYKVVYIPDPLCWTEAPNTFKILYRQRNRWYRGLAETLWMYKGFFLNKKYGIMGILSYPYWFFLEWLAPIVEICGYILLMFFIIVGKIDWIFAFLLLISVYLFSIFLSITSLIFEEFSFNQYKNKKDFFKFLLVTLIEPLGYHQYITWASFRGNFDLMFKKKSWGEMTRTGFNPTDVKKKQFKLPSLESIKPSSMVGYALFIIIFGLTIRHVAFNNDYVEIKEDIFNTTISKQKIDKSSIIEKQKISENYKVAKIEKKRYWHVIFHEIKTIKKANEEAYRLREKGYETTVIKNQKTGHFLISVGKKETNIKASDLLNKIAEEEQKFDLWLLLYEE